MSPPAQALENSDHHLRLLVESVRDYAILLLTPEGNVATWNKGAQQLIGYAADEIIGQHFSLFFPPEDVQSGKPARELQVAEKAGRFEDESWRLRKDGSRFWANIVITALRDERGELVGFAKITRDLTEHKRLEEELRRTREEAAEQAQQRVEGALQDSEARHRAILEAALDGIITIDEKATIESLNPAAERLFGYKAAEVIGKNVNILMPAPYREEHDTYLSNYLQTGQRKIIGIGREVAGRRKNGTTFPMELSVSEVFVSGRRIFMGLVHDVSERKRAEEAVRELSTPVLPVRDRLLILPIIGIIDSQRALQLTEQLLKSIRAYRAKAVVMDITGVPMVDSKVANHLLQTIDAARLMGAVVIVTGISPEISQALVRIGVDLSRLWTRGDLRGGLEEAEQIMGYTLVATDETSAPHLSS
jgi:PAS domain S-box-containing protein